MWPPSQFPTRSRRERTWAHPLNHPSSPHYSNPPNTLPSSRSQRLRVAWPGKYYEGELKTFLGFVSPTILMSRNGEVKKKKKKHGQHSGVIRQCFIPQPENTRIRRVKGSSGGKAGWKTNNTSSQRFLHHWCLFFTGVDIGSDQWITNSPYDTCGRLTELQAGTAQNNL